MTEIQKWQRYNAARTHSERYEREGEDFLRRIITLDETWTRSYDPKIKHLIQNYPRHSSRSRPLYTYNQSNRRCDYDFYIAANGCYTTLVTTLKDCKNLKHVCILYLY